MMLSSSERTVLSAMQLRGLDGEQIRHQTGLSLRTIARAKDRLIADGIIRPAVRIQPTAMGLYARWVWCSLSASGLCAEEQVVKFLKDAPQVSWVDTHGVDFDIFFTVNGYTSESIDTFIESLKLNLGTAFDRMEMVEVHSWTIFRRKLLFGLRNVTNYRHIDSVTIKGYRPNQVDDLDLTILENLSYSPHLKSLKLGEMLDMAPRTIRDRVRRLKEKEILLGDYYHLNWSKAGLGAATYLVELPHVDDTVRQNMHIFCAEHPHVWGHGAFKPGGSYHFSLGVEGGCFSEIHRIKAELIKRFAPKKIDFTIHRASEKMTVDATHYHRSFAK